MIGCVLLCRHHAVFYLHELTLPFPRTKPKNTSYHMVYTSLTCIPNLKGYDLVVPEICM